MILNDKVGGKEMNSTEKTKDKTVGEKEKLLRIQVVEPDNSEFKRKEAEKRLRGKKVKDVQKLSAEEVQRRRAEEVLSASEVRYRRLFETAKDGILILDAETGMIVDVNPFLIEMLGFLHEQLTGKAIWEIGLFKDIASNKANFMELQRQGYVRYEDLPLETVDGRRIEVEFVSNVYTVNHQKVIQCNIRDITDRIRAQDKLKKALLDLERSNKELEVFSYSVSHDLRAPLRSINGFSEALLEEYADKLDMQGKDFLQRVCAASRHMGELIEGLLNLSRVARAPLHQQAMDLSAMARSIANELRQRQPERQVEFVIAEGVMGNGDLHLLEIVLENLLSNAWKFTEKHPRARIEFGVMQKEDETVYFVRDDGAGFDMAYVDKLFGAFQRLHTKNDFEGTGIGLATVQRIIHRHGGRVWAEGGVEKGATFYFTLPKVNAAVVEETLNKEGINEEEICLIGGGQQ
jgi:PAS domain S-box-containing protein